MQNTTQGKQQKCIPLNFLCNWKQGGMKGGVRRHVG